MNRVIDRRSFIRAAGTVSLGAGILGSGVNVLARRNMSSRVSVAVMGVNNRGSALAREFVRQENAEISYICDVDENAIKKGLDAVKEAGQQIEPKTVKDIRKVLEDSSVDAVVIATPLHWAAPAAIMALQAGKHVYIEKPCSHNPHEGELLVEAANRYNRVVQQGNQRRSWPNVQEAIQLVHEGAVGDAYFARCWYANSRGSIGYGKPAPIPATLDYELWQGPAPKKEYKDNLIHYNWWWHWHWGGGELLANGIHFIDLAMLGLDVQFPSRVTSSGGRFHWKDDQETPDTHIVTYDFPENRTILWEQRSSNPRRIEGSAFGVSYHGDQGTLVIDGNSYTLFDMRNEVVKRVEPVSGYNINSDHIANFLESITDGVAANSVISDTNAGVHNCHLGNIAYRTGRTINCNPENGAIIDDADAMKYWSREYAPGWELSV